MASLTGKTALVTGANSGIGFGIARHFLSLGASVVIHGRDQAQAARAASELSSDPTACTAVTADLRDVAACRTMMREAIDWKGGLDVLVNNAGMVDRGYLENAPVELWDDIMAVNLRAPFLCLQDAVASMKTRGGGSIVNIGSVNAYIGAPKLGPYSVSKGGLMTLTRNAASALHRYKIRVNQLNVGWTLTENENVVQKREGTRTDWLRDAIAVMPFGRLLTPHEIALAAAYFASDDSALITGAVLDMEQYPLGAPADW
jgi:NAD(P)-dependent dehydrogenase (short-subunit alcohol dehydrogenase family)